MNLEQVIAQYQPSVSLPELVKALNICYHEIEAELYDQTHEEIWRQELPILGKLVDMARDGLSGSSLTVLDYGCGTGFGCGQVVKIMGGDRIKELVCVDSSPAMLDKCRERLADVFPRARYSTDPDAFLAGQEWLGRFDVVITNSVLHHVCAWQKLLNRLVEFLKPEGFYVMGHEPSVRFYANPECRMQYEAFLREWRWKKFLDGPNWVRFARRKLGFEPDLRSATARAALAAGLTRRLLPRHVVSDLVDYHVPHFEQGPARAAGLDFRLMERETAGVLNLHAVETYAYMGPFLADRLPRKWRGIGERLVKDYPLDGANFCALWKKIV
jgi:SAM-dependent methyltransferase